MTAGPATPSERVTPFHCPYCAEEDLWPVAAGALPGLAAGGWHCRSCLRVFALSYFGTHSPARIAEAVDAVSGSDLS